MPKLTDVQVEELQAEMVPDGVPVRFLLHGQPLNILDGTLMPKGLNVIHQQTYWNFTRPTARKISKWLGCKAVF